MEGLIGHPIWPHWDDLGKYIYEIKIENRKSKIQIDIRKPKIENQKLEIENQNRKSENKN
jgi:hypothetical protein